MKSIFCLLFLACLSFNISCGYTLQNSNSPLLEKEGIRRIYIYPLVNNTYKAGVENVVYNALVKTLFAHRRVVLVDKPDLADAVLRGTVDNAQSAIAALTLATGLTPNPYLPPLGQTQLVLPNPPNYSVAALYAAQLGCSFSLSRNHVLKNQNATVWAASFGRSKQFPASNQLDVPGTTSALINESELDRALSDLAQSMMADVHESMLAMF